MIINSDNIQVAFIGQIPAGVFKRLQDEGVIGPEFNDSAAEHAAFEANFLAACARPDPAAPPQVPAWRLYSRYMPEGGAGDGYFLHPYASETAFPPTKRLFMNVREAALECCDVRVSQDGAITAVAIDANPFAVIWQNKSSLVIKPVSADKGVIDMHFISAGATSPFRPDIRDVKTLTAFFKDARRHAGAGVTKLLAKPSYFPAPK